MEGHAHYSTVRPARYVEIASEAYRNQGKREVRIGCVLTVGRSNDPCGEMARGSKRFKELLEPVSSPATVLS